MKISGLILVFIFIALTVVSGQKFLLIEKSGSVHSKRFSMYDQITFQLKDDETGWYTRQILDMDPNGQMILLGDTWIPIKDISRLRMSNKRTIPMILGTALQAGGISMVLGDAWYSAIGRPEYSEGGWEWGLVNIAVGTGIKALFGPIKYTLGKHIRLRVIDVTFGTIKT